MRAPRLLFPIALLAASACGGGGTVDMHGDITVTGSGLSGSTPQGAYVEPDGSCGDSNGNVSVGMNITIEDANGRTIGTTAVDHNPTGTKESSVPGYDQYTCTFTFSAPRLPRSNFYRVSLGSGQPVTFSLQQVESDDVHLSFS